MTRPDVKSYVDPDIAAMADTAVTPPAHHLEEQLASIITTARGVAVAAEELLREITQAGGADRTTQHAIAMAPRLLAATEQQLMSVSAMLRKS